MKSTPGMNPTHAGTSIQDARHNQAHRHNETPSNTYIVQLPALLPGSRCYTDASTIPDRASSTPKKVGLFIINTETHPPQNIYINAGIADSVSVVMAEAAALTLAAAVTERLHLDNTNFLADN
jgi:hypothetical protein